MGKINEIASAAAEKGWTYEPGLVNEQAIWVRPASEGRTEKVEVWLTEGGRPRVHHAWYSLGSHYQRFEGAEVADLIDLITDPGYQPPEERTGECESHGVYGTCPEDGITYTEEA